MSKEIGLKIAAKLGRVMNIIIIGNRWEVVELNGKSRRMLVGWHEGLVIFQIKKNDFYVKYS